MTLFCFNFPFWGITYIQHNLLILNMQSDEFGQMWTVTKSLPESLYRNCHHPRGSHMALCSRFPPQLQMLATTNPLSVGIIPAYSRIFTWLLLSVVFVIHHSDCWVVFPRMDIPYLFIRGHLACFQIAACRNKTTMNIQVKVFRWTYICILGGKYWGDCLAMQWLLFTFIRTTHVSSKEAISFCIPILVNTTVGL